MSILKELQLANPIGTKFRRATWPRGKDYCYFDGHYWRGRLNLKYDPDGLDRWDDWEIYKEPVSVVRFYNVLDFGAVSGGYLSRGAADDSAHTGTRIACVRVEFVEGVFDE